MGLSFKDDKGPCQRTIVISIIKLIERNIELYLHIARILDLYDDQDEDLDEVVRQIICIINNPSLKVDTTTKQNIIILMTKVYKDRCFQNIRSDILECIIYRFGPFVISNKYECYIEPRVFDNDYLVGEADTRCDFVFYNNAHHTEFIECKADITNVIPAEIPLEKIKKSHRQKVNYLVKAYHYLNGKYREPAIFFACYNTNYDRQLKNIQNNWGLEFVNFLGPQDICNYYTYS